MDTSNLPEGLKTIIEIERAVSDAVESAPLFDLLPETDQERAARMEQDARVRRMDAVQCGFMARDPEARPSLPTDYAYNDAPMREYARRCIALHHMEMGASADELPRYEAMVTDEEIDLFVAVVRG